MDSAYGVPDCPIGPGARELWPTHSYPADPGQLVRQAPPSSLGLTARIFTPRFDQPDLLFPDGGCRGPGALWDFRVETPLQT